MRKNLKAIAQAAQAQQNATASAAIMHVAPTDAAEQATSQDAAPVAEATPEVEQPSPLSIATDAPTAPAPLADFTPLLAPTPRPLDELLDLVRKAKSVTERLTSYKATSEKLGGFELAKEGYSDRLTIKDGNGSEWATSQSSIIQKVLDVLRGELGAAIETTEAELRHLLPVAA